MAKSLKPLVLLRFYQDFTRGCYYVNFISGGNESKRELTRSLMDYEWVVIVEGS